MAMLSLPKILMQCQVQGHHVLCLCTVIPGRTAPYDWQYQNKSRLIMTKAGLDNWRHDSVEGEC